MNKKGFLKIVEAFIAILIISGVMIFVYVNNIQSPRQEDYTYQVIRLALKDISNDEAMRENILNVNPFEDSSAEGFDSNSNENAEIIAIANRLSQLIPPEFDFRFRVCELDDACGLQNLPNKNVFSDEVSVSSTLTNTGCLPSDSVGCSPEHCEPSCEFFPKKIRLFIWSA